MNHENLRDLLHRMDSYNYLPVDKWPEWASYCYTCTNGGISFANTNSFMKKLSYFPKSAVTKSEWSRVMNYRNSQQQINKVMEEMPSLTVDKVAPQESFPLGHWQNQTKTDFGNVLRRETKVKPKDPSILALFNDALIESIQASRKYPQPNYIITKVAEEAGEVVQEAIRCVEGKGSYKDLRAEIVQAIAMLIRLYSEGDQVHGLKPVCDEVANEN